MPASGRSDHMQEFSRNDELEDIEILKNLLEVRTMLVKEEGGIEAELE